MQIQGTWRNTLPWKTLGGLAGRRRGECCFFSLSESLLFLGWELSHVQSLSASSHGSACVSLNLPLRGFPDDEDAMVPVQGLWVRSLIGELTSHMPCGTAKNFLKSKPPSPFSW